MSDIETLKLLADAGVGIVSLIVLVIVVRTGNAMLRDSATLRKEAEAREDKAHQRAETAVEESEKARKALIDAQLRISELERQLEDAMRTIDELHQQVERTTKRLDAAEHKLETARKETVEDKIALDSVSRELKSALARVTELMDKLAISESQARELRLENKRLIDDNAGLQTRLRDSETKVTALQTQVTALQQKVETLEKRATEELTPVAETQRVEPEAAG